MMKVYFMLFLSMLVLHNVGCTSGDNSESSSLSVDGIEPGIYKENVSFSINSSYSYPIEYSLDDGQTWQPYSRSVHLSNQGNYTVLARTRNDRGNEIETDPVTFSILFDLEMPLYLTYGAILQRGKEIVLNGGCLNTKSVVMFFNEKKFESPCVDNRWSVTLDAMDAGGPYDAVFQWNRGSITLKDIRVGDVWFASGQSNMVDEMVYTKRACLSGKKLKFFNYAPRVDNKTFRHWASCTGTSFSKLAGTFGIGLASNLNIPIGVIVAAQEGTSTICWKKDNPCYSDLIKESTHYPITGIIWWQGESDAIQTELAPKYAANSAVVFTEFKHLWQDTTLPIFFAQLQAYIPLEKHQDVANQKTFAIVRDQQALLESYFDHTSMIVTYDITNGDIHPPDKSEVADRFINTALALYYDMDVPYERPRIISATYTDSTVEIIFSDGECEDDLSINNYDDLKVINADGEFLSYTPEIRDHTLILTFKDAPSSDEITVSFAQENYPASVIRDCNHTVTSPFTMILTRE